MRNEAERKVEDKKLQLGSLNDALRDTVREIEKKYVERDELRGNVDSLCLEVEKKEKEFTKLKHNYLIVELRHDKDVKQAEGRVLRARDEMDSVVTFLIKVKGRVKKAQIRIDTLSSVLKIENKKLRALKKEIGSLEDRQEKINKLDKDIFLLHKSENDLLDVISEERLVLKRVGVDITKEKKEHRKWLKETSVKAREELARATSKTDALNQTRTDLMVVERRLKRIWGDISESKFPKIHNA